MASVLKFVALNQFGSAGVTIDFLAAAAVWRVGQWSPAVAVRRAGELGGRGPYEDVDEAMTISIAGASAQSHLASLRGLLEQAARWARGEPVGVVKLHYKPTASSEELTAVVMGGSVELPENYVNTGAQQMIDPVVVRFRRAALWLGGTSNGTDATTTNPETAVISGFTSRNVPAPIKVDVDLSLYQATVWNSFLLISSGIDAATAGKRVVVISNPSSFAPGGGFSTPADMDNKARGNTVLRLTPAYAESYHTSEAVPVASATDQYARRWGVFINYRNNSGAVSFRVKANLYNSTYPSQITPTAEMVIPAGASKPRWAFVGAASLPDSLERVELVVWASATGGTLDIDDVVLMALDFPESDVAIAIHDGGSAFAYSGAFDLTVDHRLGSHLSPVVVTAAASGVGYLPHQGDGTVYMREGCAAVAVAFLGSGFQNPDYWRLTIGTTVINPSVTVTRTNSYLTPN